MFNRSWIVAALMCPALAFGGDRLSYLTVDQDNAHTGISTIVCKIQASRLLKSGTFSGVVFFQWQPVTGAGYSFSSAFEVSPAAATYVEDSPGAYKVTATLVNGRVLVVTQVPTPLSPQDVVYCNARIDQGAKAAPLGTVYAANLRYADQTP